MAQAVVSSVKSLVSETWPQPRNAVHLFTLKGIQWKFQTFRLGEGGGEGGHPDPEIRGGVSKKFFFGPSDLDPPLAYMYADQTSKLLVIFFVPPYLYLWLLYKVFQWKNLKTAVWLSFAVLFFFHVCIPWRIVFEDSDHKWGTDDFTCRSGLESLIVWNVTRLIAPPLPNGQPLIRGGVGGRDKCMNNNQINSKRICVFCRTWLNTTWLTVSCHSTLATQIQDYG